MLGHDSSISRLKRLCLWMRSVLREDIARHQLTALQRLWAGVLLVWDELYASDFLTRAAAISYNLVFSLVPLITTSLAFITAFPGLREQREEITGWLFSQLLPGAMQAVQGYIAQFSERAAAAGAVSSLVLLVFVLLVFQGVEQACNHVWTVEKQRTWGERIRALAFFFFFSAIMLAALIALSRFAPALTEKSLLLRVLAQLLSAVIAIIAFTAAIMLLPNARVHFVPGLIAGSIAGLAWFGLKVGFNWYLENLATYQNIYGALGIVPAFFLWVYLSAALLLGGSQVAFVAQNLRALILKRQTRDGSSPRAFYSTAVAIALHRAFLGKEGPLSADMLAERLHVASYFVTEALCCLTASSLLLAIHGREATQRYVLQRPAESITVHDVIVSSAGDVLVLPHFAEEEQVPDIRATKTLFERAALPDGNLLRQTTIADLAR